MSFFLVLPIGLHRSSLIVRSFRRPRCRKITRSPRTATVKNAVISVVVTVGDPSLSFARDRTKRPLRLTVHTGLVKFAETTGSVCVRVGRRRRFWKSHTSGVSKRFRVPAPSISLHSPVITRTRLVTTARRRRP